MKRLPFFALLAGLTLSNVVVAPVYAQDSAQLDPAADLSAVVAKIRNKMRDGRPTEATLAAEIKEFDALFAKYREANPEAAARMLAMKASLYTDVLNEAAKAEPIIAQLKKEFPNSGPVQQMEQREQAEKAKEAVKGKAAPELNFTWANQEGLKTLSGLKGKVVVLDFWATWCGPCVDSFPNIKELTDHYKGYDVEVIGVTSLQGRVHGLEKQPVDCRDNPAKEMALMTDYIKAKGINWTIAFASQEVFNPEYGVNGIPHMAIVGPDGKVRANGIHPGAMPLAEKTKIIDGLLKEAGLKTPPAL